MKTFTFRITCGFLLILSSMIVAQAQYKYKFDGFVRNTEDYTTKTPISGATVTISKEDDTTATGITDCSDSDVGNSVSSNSSGYFCFKGPATR